MTEALEPCPFCSSINLSECHTIARSYVQCHNCKTLGPDGGANAWNTRAPAAPEGWQLVPIEPTHEMLDDAIWAAAEKITIEDGVAMFGFDAARAVYAANLAAAPKPKGQRQ